MSTGCVYRPATKQDVRKIAELYLLSSDGLVEYLWRQNLQPGETPLDAGARRYAREGTDFSYENCIMAEIDGRVCGMMVAFPMHADPVFDPATYPDPIMRPYAILEEDNSYYICGVAVFDAFRNRGIGTKFMALAEDRATEKGLDKLSLIVFEQNTGAKRLYERLGYKEVMREPVVPHPLLKYTGDALLMVKALK